MSIQRSQSIRRSLSILAIALSVALSTVYGPVLLNELGGTTVTPLAYACQHTGGSCG
jgi:hypothetical protein